MINLFIRVEVFCKFITLDLKLPRYIKGESIEINDVVAYS